jgi:hypothetical protein
MRERSSMLIALLAGICCVLFCSNGYIPSSAEGALANEKGWMTARIRLEGRHLHSGALVSVDGWQQVTGTDGYVFFLLPDGYHTITVSMNGYLCAQRRFEIRHNRPIDLFTVTLLAGDADGNRIIDFLDLVIVQAAFGSAPPSDSRADINGDGRVDILDALLVGGNLGKEAPSFWPGGWASPFDDPDSTAEWRDDQTPSVAAAWIRA